MEIKGFSWDWHFAEGWDESYAVAVPSASKEIDLPHTVVTLPYNYFDERVYRKDFCYFKEFDVHPEKGKRYFVRFEAFMVQADIYLNGVRLGHYVSLYFPVTIDLTAHLKDGKNLLAIHLNGDEDPTIPPFGGAMDYLTYAGIYRPVHLEVLPAAHFTSILVHASLDGKVEVKATATSDQGILLYEVYDRSGKLVMSSGTSHFTIPNPRPWTLDDPYLYELHATFAGDNGTDERHVRFGLRDIEWTGKGFYLNHRPLKLIGLNRHQSYPYIGYASTSSLEREDARLLKEEAGVNVVRTSHYLDSEAFINACDELGLLVIDEVPGWQHLSEEAAWRSHYYSFIEKLAYAGYNHPSVIAHGIRIDESLDDHELYSRGNAICRAIDPYRPTLGVRNIRHSELLEDIYAYNDFDGQGKRALAHPSEAGAKGHPYIVTEHTGHMNPTKMTDSLAQALSQAKDHERKIDACFRDPHIAGCIGWCFADYNTHATFGSGDMVCAHGVYSMFRMPKYAAYVYASQQEKFPVFELLTDLKTGEFKEARFEAIPIATNCDYFELSKNGRFVGRFYPKKGKKGIPHPIYYLEDVVGESLQDNRFHGKDRKLLSSVLSYAAIHGYAHLKLKHKLAAGYLMLKYHLVYKDLLGLFNQEIASWGGDGRGNVYRFTAYKGGSKVIEKEFGASTRFHIEAEADRDTLVNGDTYDIATVKISYRDEHGTLMNFPSLVLEAEAGGAIELLSPAKSILLGGTTRLYVRSKKGSGEGSLRVKYGDETKEIHFTVK